MQSLVEAALATILASGARFDYADVQRLAAPRSSPVPEVRISAPDLHSYDALLVGGVR
jgi:hypothetical protein